MIGLNLSRRVKRGRWEKRGSWDGVFNIIAAAESAVGGV